MIEIKKLQKDIDLKFIGLSKRSFNRLKYAGINTANETIDSEKLWEWNKNRRRLQRKLDYRKKAAKYKEEEQKKEIRAAIKLENDISEYSKLYGRWHNHTVYTSCSP